MPRFHIWISQGQGAGRVLIDSSPASYTIYSKFLHSPGKNTFWMHVNKFRGVKYYQTYILFVTLISDQAKIYGTHRIMIAPYELFCTGGRFGMHNKDG